jgi:hypothetical protein
MGVWLWEAFGVRSIVLALDKLSEKQNVHGMTMLLEGSARAKLPPLENGEHLDAEEFLRRYEAMPEVRKAELIQGRVYMAIPLGVFSMNWPNAR